jgi:hypothetical protein
MNPKNLASTAAVAAVMSLGLSVQGEAQEPAGTFTEITPLGPEINSPFHDHLPCASGDGLSLAIASDRAVGSGSREAFDMYIADRPDTGQPFPEVRIIEELNTSTLDYPNFLSEDGLTLYFTTDFPHPGSSGSYDIYFSRRLSREEPFGEPQPVPGINSADSDYAISLTADGLEAYFNSHRPGSRGADIWVGRRSSADDDEPFTVRNLQEVNTIFWESAPSISADGLTLMWGDDFFGDSLGSGRRIGGHGGLDLWWASRASRQDPFGKTTNLGSPVNTIAAEFWARFSPRWPEDGSILYFGRCMTCNHDSDIYQAIWRVTPPPSFIRGEANDDGKLDLSDAVFILGFLFLGATEPTCREALDANDDGGIDIADAISLLGHLFLGSPPTLPGLGVCETLDGSATLGCESSSRQCDI